MYNFNTVIPQRLVVAFKGYLNASTVSNESVMPSITATPGEPLSQRCGRTCGGPFDDDDRVHMFLHKLNASLAELRTVGDDVSSFFVKRSIYLAFFGPVGTSVVPAPSPNINQREDTMKETATDNPGRTDEGTAIRAQVSNLNEEPDPNNERNPARNEARLPEV